MFWQKGSLLTFDVLLFNPLHTGNLNFASKFLEEMIFPHYMHFDVCNHFKYPIIPLWVTLVRECIIVCEHTFIYLILLKYYINPNIS